MILPNNKNVVGAAEQAADLAAIDVRVVPTHSFPQAVAALLAFDPETPIEQNLTAMRHAIDGVHAGEVTRTVRATTIDGRPVAEGQLIGLVDEHLVAAGDDL